MDPLPVTLLRNWLYCGREVYYTEAMGLAPARTHKMKQGRAAHDEMEGLVKRRGLAAYGCAGRRKLFRHSMTSSRLGISGTPDLLLEGEEAIAAVDFKLTRLDPGEADWLQLAAYGLLAEEEFGKPVDRLMVHRIPDDRIFGHEFDIRSGERVRQVLGEVRDCAERQVDPGPCADAARCRECPWQNFCGDVW